MLRHRFLFVGTVIGCTAFASLALAQFPNQLPAGCQKEISTQLTNGKSYHGAKCTSPTCLCSAFQCKGKGGKTTYEQAKCQAAPS
jgi:hypothetical protein